MKHIIIHLIITAIFAACLYGVYRYVRLLRDYPEAEPELQPKLVIELVFELQEAVGARPDGKIGPETTRLVNAQCEMDKPEYFNKLAKPYFTESGAPKK